MHNWGRSSLWTEIAHNLLNQAVKNNIEVRIPYVVELIDLPWLVFGSE
jgi:hypothetical protein